MTRPTVAPDTVTLPTWTVIIPVGIGCGNRVLYVKAVCSADAIADAKAWLLAKGLTTNWSSAPATAFIAGGPSTGRIDQ